MEVVWACPNDAYDFARGKWTDLIEAAHQNVQIDLPLPRVGDEKVRRGLAVQSRVQRGQVSRARHELTGTPLAPKTEATLQDMQSWRFDVKLFVKCLRTAPSGSAPGPGGCTNEMLRVCLDDVETLALLVSAAEDFARAETPDVTRSFMLATMTALQKKDGGVRGIATGTSFRRLVAKTLARQFSAAVETTCAPFPICLLCQLEQAWIVWGTL